MQDLNFSDSFIFCKVMQDEKLCQQMLEILLDIKVDHLVYSKEENTIENFYNSRGVRLDVYVKDSERIFDLEMQTCNYEDLLLRTRYYQGSIDMSETERGSSFSQLKESYIIFICKEDPVGAGGYVYTRESFYKEFPNIFYNDKSHVVFYNSKAYNKAEKPEVRDVLEFIYNFKSNSAFTNKLEQSVLNAKVKPEWRKEYMFFDTLLKKEKAESKEEGRKEGALKSAISNAIAMLKDGMDKDKVVQYSGLSLEKVEELAKSI